MKVPAVRGYGTAEQESFGAYIERWPDSLSNFPACVVEHWVYRHWQQFNSNWAPRSPQDFRFRQELYSNSQVKSIGHVHDWLKTADYWGDELFTRPFRRES